MARWRGCCIPSTQTDAFVWTLQRHEAVARESEKHRELHDDAHERLQQTLSDLETLRRNHNELQQQRDARRNDDETVTQLREEMEALQSDYAHQEEVSSSARESPGCSDLTSSSPLRAHSLFKNCEVKLRACSTSFDSSLRATMR